MAGIVELLLGLGTDTMSAMGGNLIVASKKNAVGH